MRMRVGPWRGAQGSAHARVDPWARTHLDVLQQLLAVPFDPLQLLCVLATQLGGLWREKTPVLAARADPPSSTSASGLAEVPPPWEPALSTLFFPPPKQRLFLVPQIIPWSFICIAFCPLL